MQGAPDLSAPEIRFVEYIDVGGATRWSMDQVVSRQEMLAALRADPRLEMHTRGGCRRREGGRGELT